MPRRDAHGYPARLAIADPGEPSAVALHAAHIERMAHGAIEIHLSRPTTVDPYG